MMVQGKYFLFVSFKLPPMMKIFFNFSMYSHHFLSFWWNSYVPAVELKEIKLVITLSVKSTWKEIKIGKNQR